VVGDVTNSGLGPRSRNVLNGFANRETFLDRINRRAFLIAQDGGIRMYRVREGARTTWEILSGNDYFMFDVGGAARCTFNSLVAASHGVKEGAK
jgi:hypothetical protein